jgi:hypothetical protein
LGKHSAGKRDNIMAPSRFDLQVRLAVTQATSMASRRRTTRKIGAVAGGLLGLALLPLAVAHADDWTVSPDPLSNEIITGIYGYGFGGSLTTPPSVSGSIQGYGVFDYNDVTTGNSGEFNGIESTSHDGLGDVNQAVYVTSDVSGTDAPSTGSVFDTANMGDGAFVNVYSDIYSPSGDTITDTVETPYGNYTIPTTFDAAHIPVADAGGVAIGNGDIIDPAGSQTVSAITGIPPLFVAYQGSEPFYVDGSESPAFNADNTITQDVLGTYTEAVLVTSDAKDATVGTAGGDVPAAGSIFNTIDYGGIQNVYSDLTSTTGGADVITDTLDTPTGDYIIPITFDAAKAETTSAMNLPDGADLTPQGAFDYSGVNGLPPENVSVQGTQTFLYTDGDSSGTLHADVTNTLDLFGNTDETLLVTSSTDPEAPVGSVFETVNWADTGIENVYSDIVSATGGADTITDTLVTPWGDFTIPIYLDAAADLAADSFSGI